MLDGKRILIVEDEPIVAMMLEDMLAELGSSPTAPALSVADAMAVLEDERPDAAILDVNLGRERSDAIADRLRDIGVPIVFATGYGRDGFPAHGAEVIEKPYRQDDVAAALCRVLRAISEK